MKPHSFASIHYLVMTVFVALFAASNHAACESVWFQEHTNLAAKVTCAAQDTFVAETLFSLDLSILDAVPSSCDDLGVRGRRNTIVRCYFPDRYGFDTIVVRGMPGPMESITAIVGSDWLMNRLSTVRLQV